MEEELEFMSNKTGLPSDQIMPALNLYSELFKVPIKAYGKKSDAVKRILFHPMPFLGVGGLARINRYWDLDWSKVDLARPDKIDLSAWVNSLNEFIGIEQSEKMSDDG